MTPLPNEIAVVINRINDNIVSDWKDKFKDAANPLLPCFLVNGRAFYNNLFMPAMIEEVKVERRGKRKSQGSGAKKLQEIMEVSTTELDRKLRYNY
jgi:hypothetical protein